MHFKTQGVYFVYQSLIHRMLCYLKRHEVEQLRCVVFVYALFSKWGNLNLKLWSVNNAPQNEIKFLCINDQWFFCQDCECRWSSYTKRKVINTSKYQ